MAVNPQKQLNDFCGDCDWGPFLARSLKYFFKLWKISTLRLPLIFSKSWMVFFSCCLKYLILFHTYNISQKWQWCDPKFALKIFSHYKTFCANWIERVFRINLQITHVKPFACNWNGRWRNSPCKESSRLAISGNFWQFLAISASRGHRARVRCKGGN